MTDYDLRTREALRRVVLLEYGFGPETLRGRKVCPVCGRASRADRTHCADCGARLPECRVYLLCEDGHPEKQAALEKAVELGLIDGFCIGDLAAEQMRTWLDETAETINGRSAR